jgi:hypothetical protein
MRIERLARMGVAEIAFRGRQKANQWIDRLSPVSAITRGKRTHRSMNAGTPMDAKAAFALFRDAAPRRFFAGTENGAAADILREELPAACRELIARANAPGAKRFDLLGYEALSFGEPTDWHLDPVAGVRAPGIHWSRINFLDPGTVGDAKVTWELNRHQWLLPLAQAYWLTADERYAQEVADVVDDWSRANPYGKGINWASSLEVAYRVISWSWLFILIRDSGAVSVPQFAEFLAQVRAHASHIERYLSRYYAPNTHLTGEALALFYVGLLFPELPEAARWRRLGHTILVEQSARQVLPDGVYFEQATGYHRYTLDIYMHFLILAARNAVFVPEDVRRRTERMVEFLIAISAPDRAMPQIGDSDAGWLLPLARRDSNDCRGSFAVAAALFDRPDFLWAAGGPTPEVLWLLGASAWETLRKKAASPPAEQSSTFRDGGYSVMRSSWASDAHQMVVDVGPIGSRVSGAHAHADLLGIQCWAFGEPFIVDPGTFSYADPSWRDHFRGTSAHSTVVVDGLSQARPSGLFTWHSQPTATLRDWKPGAEHDYLDASHDAYRVLPDPVTHRRRVFFAKARYWVVVDDLIGLDRHELELRFQFSARPVTAGPGSWVRAEGKRHRGLWLAPFTDTPLEARIRIGETNPIEGWVSSDYGRKVPAPSVSYAWRAGLPARVVTLIMPVDRLGAEPPAVTVLRDSAGSLTGLKLDGLGETVLIDERAIVVDAVELVGPVSGGVR